MDAVDVMDSLRVDTLKSIAKQAGISKSITRKAELVKALNSFVTSAPAEFVDRLAPVERSLLAEAVHNDNRVEPVVFSAKYKVDCPKPRPHGGNGSLIHMVISGDRYSTEIEVPQAIADLLRPLVPRPTAAKPESVKQIPDTLDWTDERWRAEPTDIRPIHVFCGERTVFLELRRMLQLVQGGKARVQPKSGRPTPATQRAMTASLAAPDFELELPAAECDEHTLKSGQVRAYAWAMLVQQCGWCKASQGVLKLTREGQRLLQEGSAELLRDGIKRLAMDDKVDELQRINNIRGQTGNARSWMTTPSERREAILGGLAEWPLNEWLAFDEAYRFLNACGYPFTVTEDPTSLYFCEQRYGYITEQDGIDRQYMRVLLFESLATLGLVDIAFVYPHFLWPELGGGWGTDDMDFCGRYDGLLYVRMNPLGMYCLGTSDEYTPPPAQKRSLFTLLPNHEIAVAKNQQLLPGDVSMLELFALKKSDHLWRVDRKLILDYLECGGSLDDISRFLAENATEEGIPETVRVFLDDLQARANAVANTEEAWLVEFQDPAVAELVAQDPKCGKLCLLSGDRHVVVAKSHERAFRSAVKKLGYVLPR